VRRFPGYGKLSGRTLEDMLAGARVVGDERKQDPMDFALWKAAKPGEPAWDSPWGQGRPGWHIECSAMSLKYLGTHFDIHGGGFDLVFPHHENEVAQSEASTGEPFVRYWMHNGFITVNEEKMSKSLGNFFLIRDILAKFPPELVRFFLLSTHYRSPLDFDDEQLAAAGRGLERIKTCVRLLAEALVKPVDVARVPLADGLTASLTSLKRTFEAAMDDDCNTALGTSVLFDLARETNSTVGLLAPSVSQLDREALEKALALFKVFNEVLGIFKTDAAGNLLLDGAAAESAGLVEGLVNLLVEIR
jgi:cysteinyl-tRNA synthetase